MDVNTISLQKVVEQDGSEGMRQLPHAIAAEKSILSTMMKDSARYVTKAVEERLTPEHFYLPSHVLLFRLFLEFSDGNQVVEAVTLIQRLMDRGQLDYVGGASYLAEVQGYANSAAHFVEHLGLVKDKFTLRSIIETSNEAIASAFDAPEEVGMLLDQVETRILGIRENQAGGKEATLAQTLDEVMRDFRRMVSGEIQQQGLSTGFEMLDRMSGGLKAGEMFVVAARPSMGKTSFMMNVVEHICVDQGVPSLVFSCEMSTVQLVDRLLFSRAEYAKSNLNAGLKPTKSEVMRITRTVEELKHTKLFIDDTPGITIGELRAKARRLKREHDIQFVAIDYLQLLRSPSKQAVNSREREVAEISGGIKALAKELHVPVLILAQLNRGPESRSGTRKGVPEMSDMRESGAIEQDADLVGLLYREKYYAEEEEKEAKDGIACLRLAKNRNGETGEIPLTFVDTLMRFRSGKPVPEPHG